MEEVPKKSLGQHWLYDHASLEAMADAAEISQGDIVIEIGPGLGTLTEVLLARSALVTAVEFDSELAKQLRQKQLPGLTVVEHDILRFDFTSLPPGYKIAANIPYYLTAHLLRILTETLNKPTVAALLVQKEVVERLAARPGDMSVLAVAVQYSYEVQIGAEVPAGLFTPPPKVDSQIVVLRQRSEPLFRLDDEKHFFRIVRAGFSQRRKKLRGSLSGGLGISKEATDTLLQHAGIDGNLRAQNLSLQQWYDLYMAHRV